MSRFPLSCTKKDLIATSKLFKLFYVTLEPLEQSDLRVKGGLQRGMKVASF